MNSADIDGDGKITFYEFVKANSRGIFKTKLSKAQSEQLKELFIAHDVNKDGYLSKEELENLLNSLGNGLNVKELLDSIDINNDGHLDFNEFIVAASAGHF